MKPRDTVLQVRSAMLWLGVALWLWQLRIGKFRQEHLLTKHLIAVAAAVLALQGCATQIQAPSVAADDFNDGIAKSCTASPIDFAVTPATATVALTNDGWCGIRTAEKDGQAFQLGLVKARPEHGFVIIRKVGVQTRIEYSAEGRYVGTDRFTVALRSKTANVPDTTVQIAVTVSMGAAPPAPPAPPPPATPARRPTPTRR